MFSKLTIRHQNVVNNVVLETLVLTLNRYIFVFFFFFFFFGVSIVDFKQIKNDRVVFISLVVIYSL